MILNQIIKNKELVGLFNGSYELYMEGNKLLKREYERYSFADNLIFSWEDENIIEGFRKNFFTLLMGSIILKTGSSRENNLAYMEILTCLRQIITSTDNIVDGEEKGLIFFRNLASIPVKNTMLNIATQEVMSSVIRSLGREELDKRWIEKIYNIACGESLRDISQYERYPGRSYIRDRIHRGIGGELLELSLTVPAAIEGDKIRGYSKGLFKIGMALQALDDLCDVEEDVEENKVNLAVSYLVERNLLGEERVMTGVVSYVELEEGLKQIREEYLQSTVEEGIEGFMILQKNGYPITRLDIVLLLRYLFKIRGLEDLWELVQCDL